MPSIEDLQKKQKKRPFKKKTYRAWLELSGEDTDTSTNAVQTQDNVSTNAEKKKDESTTKTAFSPEDPVKPPISAKFDDSNEDDPFPLTASETEHNSVQNTHNINTIVVQNTDNDHTIAAQDPTDSRTKSLQTPIKSVSNPVQSPDKLQTNISTQFHHDSVQTQYKFRTDIRSTVNQMPVNFLDLKSKISRFTSLTGKRKAITLFIYESCKISRSPMSDPFTLEAIANACATTPNTAEGTLRRLVKEGFLFKIDGKKGRGAWHIYGLPEDIYQEILRLDSGGKLQTSLVQSPYKIQTEPRTETRTTVSSSSSSSLYMNKKLTTEEEPMQNSKSSDLPPEWLEIEFTELVELGLRFDDRFEFGNKQLFQWFSRKYCTAKEAQESINHFTFQLRNAKKEDFHKGPFVYFMGTMARDHYFNRPDGYVSPEEAALKRRAEDMKRKNENIRRLQEEIFDESFEAWFNTLNGNDLSTLVPHFTGYDKKKLTIKSLFRDQHWMTIRDNSNVDVTQLKILGQRDIDQANQEDMEIMKLTDAIRTLKGALDSPNLDSPNRLRFQDTLQLKLTERRSFINSKQELIDKYAEIDAYDSESHSLNLTDHLTQTI